MNNNRRKSPTLPKAIIASDIPPRSLCYLLDALRGGARTLGDNYVRVFDVFRHVADRVPTHASQHPVFKVTAMERDIVLAMIPKRTQY